VSGIAAKQNIGWNVWIRERLNERETERITKLIVTVFETELGVNVYLENLSGPENRSLGWKQTYS
jgi:hypothetical protein